MIVGLLFLFVGCTRSNPVEPKTYNLSGKTYGIVKQDKLNIEGNRITFTLSLEDINPTGPEFKKYNSQFIDDNKVKFVYIDRNTKVYDENDTLIKPDEIVFGRRVSLIVQFINDYLLLADEVRIVE
jgi:hypothetical protein